LALVSSWCTTIIDTAGFGRSSQPTVGYDYDTFSAGLNALLQHLDLDDILFGGFSMGTGEVIRYLGNYGSSRVRKAALFGAIQASSSPNSGPSAHSGRSCAARPRGPRQPRTH
jgi:non-heme chloroperoxidase